MRVNVSSSKLLSWYDINAREMPWRIPPHESKSGEKPDPYKIWLSEIMLQQTTVATVKSYFIKFITLWPTVFDLAKANDNDVMAAWAGLGYYARARNLLKCARIIVTDLEGVFPTSLKELQMLPGVGPYTSAAIAAIAFNFSETVVDGNVERVMARIYAITKPLPSSKPELYECAKRITPKQRPGDFAQAVMDLGSTVCLPRNPKCQICPWENNCQANQKNIAQKLPIKLKKPPKPTRYGIIYVVNREDGAWLLERRETRGLLGGMLGWPTSEWSEKATEDAPITTKWVTSTQSVHHIFTHFKLNLIVKIAFSPTHVKPKSNKFNFQSDFVISDLPKLMQKVFAVALIEIKKNPALKKAGQ